MSGHLSERTFIGTSALLFLGSAAATIALCGSMTGMGGMPMAGGWMLSGGGCRCADRAGPVRRPPLSECGA